MLKARREDKARSRQPPCVACLPPPPKRRRSRRLRKKLQIEEFQQLGFAYELAWHVSPSSEEQERFIDQLLDEIIAPRDLSLGGGCTVGFVSGHRRNLSEADRSAFDSWARQWPGIRSVVVEGLTDAWYDGSVVGL